MLSSVLRSAAVRPAADASRLAPPRAPSRYAARCCSPAAAPRQPHVVRAASLRCNAAASSALLRAPEAVAVRGGAREFAGQRNLGRRDAAAGGRRLERRCAPERSFVAGARCRTRCPAVSGRYSAPHCRTPHAARRAASARCERAGERAPQPRTIPSSRGLRRAAGVPAPSAAGCCCCKLHLCANPALAAKQHPDAAPGP